MAKITIKKCDSISDQVEQIRAEVRARAYEISKRNGSEPGRDLEYWLEAERELINRPCIELREQENGYDATIAAPGMDPRDLKVSVSRTAVLVTTEVSHEHKEDTSKLLLCDFARGRLFREIEFPREINPDSVKLDFKAGVLRLKAEIAKVSKPRKARGQAA
jgi:HSP20 family molecular chaperone IbpA